MGVAYQILDVLHRHALLEQVGDHHRAEAVGRDDAGQARVGERRGSPARNPGEITPTGPEHSTKGHQTKQASMPACQPCRRSSNPKACGYHSLSMIVVSSADPGGPSRLLEVPVGHPVGFKGRGPHRRFLGTSGARGRNRGRFRESYGSRIASNGRSGAAEGYGPGGNRPSGGVWSVGVVPPMSLELLVEEFAHVVQAVLVDHQAAHPDQLPARPAHLAGLEWNEALAGLSATQVASWRGHSSRGVVLQVRPRRSRTRERAASGSWSIAASVWVLASWRAVALGSARARGNVPRGRQSMAPVSWRSASMRSSVGCCGVGDREDEVGQALASVAKADGGHGEVSVESWRWQ